MKSLSLSEKEAADRIFSNSIYKNSHLGWLDLWELPEKNGSIFLDETGSGTALLGYQPASAAVTWLHSFYFDRNPEKYDLSRALKESGLPPKSTVYTISSHRWYSVLLEAHSFKKCDEIIQLETTDIRIPVSVSDLAAQSFDSEAFALIYTRCETSFPVLWRLGTDEFLDACTGADYRRMICSGGTVCGYLLAEISEGHCHILRIASARDHQTQGIASALLRQLILDCTGAGISSYSVNTNRNNQPALSLYRSLNLKQAGKTYPVRYKYI